MDVELQEKSDWSKIRITLNQSYIYDKHWEESIQLFVKRLRRKYFDPVELIILNKALKGEGFTILTVQCALLEMFAAFRQGKIFNHHKNSASPKYEYKESQKMFTSLLQTATIFKDNFWQFDAMGNKLIDQPYNSKDFYKNVRCGLMHEARTKGNWYITATPRSKSVKTESSFIVTEGSKIKIYRTVLHYRLLDYLNEYANELRAEAKSGEGLRKNFARNLDHLFDFLPDKKFDWWTE